MQEKVVDWLYNLQSRWGILKEEERSLYEYAYRLLLSRILIYSIIIALGIITGNWLEMFSFLLPFVILRQYVGGIHLKRSVSCICVSGFLIFICGKYLAFASMMYVCIWKSRYRHIWFQLIFWLYQKYRLRVIEKLILRR